MFALWPEPLSEARKLYIFANSDVNNQRGYHSVQLFRRELIDFLLFLGERPEVFTSDRVFITVL